MTAPGTMTPLSSTIELDKGTARGTGFIPGYSGFFPTAEAREGPTLFALCLVAPHRAVRALKFAFGLPAPAQSRRSTRRPAPSRGHWPRT